MPKGKKPTAKTPRPDPLLDLKRYSDRKAEWLTRHYTQAELILEDWARSVSKFSEYKNKKLKRFSYREINTAWHGYTLGVGGILPVQDPAHGVTGAMGTYLEKAKADGLDFKSLLKQILAEEKEWQIRNQTVGYDEIWHKRDEEFLWPELYKENFSATSETIEANNNSEIQNEGNEMFEGKKILDIQDPDLDNDLKLIDALMQEDELLLSSVELAHNFSRSDLETELDARYVTSVAGLRDPALPNVNPALSDVSDKELLDVVMNYRAYHRPEALQTAQAMAAGKSNTTEREYDKNATYYNAELRAAIQKEFDDFKALEFKKSASEVFADMDKIRFFTEVSNFLINESNVAALPDAVVNGLLSETPNALNLMYDFTVRRGAYSFDNPNEVRAIIDNYAEDYYPQNGAADTRTPEELMKEPLYGLCYNWKGLKEENTVYTAAQLSAEDPNFNPELDVQDGAFAANKTYIIYKLNGATVEETAANVKAFLTGSKNDTFEGGNMPKGWYWETVDMNLFTGEYNPTAKKLIEHFGLNDADLRMQEPEQELSPLEKLKAQAAEYVKTTGKPHVLFEWSESGDVPDNTIMTFEDADRLLRNLNFAFQDVGYDKTKLHIFYQNGEGADVETYGELRYDIGTETAGLVEHIEDYANNSDLVAAGFTNAEEQQGRLHVANILKEYMQTIDTKENLEKEVQGWRELNYANFITGHTKEYSVFPQYMSVPYNEFSEATGWGCAVEELDAWGKEHQRGTQAQKQWIEDYLEDINFHTANGLLHEGNYTEFFKYVEQERIAQKLEEIRQQDVPLFKLETRIDLASKYTLEELQSELNARYDNNAERPVSSVDPELRSALSDIRTEDLAAAIKDNSVYGSEHAPKLLRVYKNFAGEPLPEEKPGTAQEQEPQRKPKQKQNIKTVLGGKYNAEELQKYLTKELEENALKSAQSEKEFLSFLASFRSRQYSVRNQLMLYIQAAQNGYMPIFGTFEEWKGKGTSIQPGTHGLTICRPIFADVYYEEINVDGEIKKQRYVKFATAKEKLKELEEGVKAGKVEKKSELTHFIYTDSVFSMSQTTMTEEQRIEYLQRYNALNTSTENAELYEKLKVIAAELGRPVIEKSIQGEELGWVERADNGSIVIKSDMPIDAKISVLTHELGHKLLHVQNAAAENRAQMEVQAQLFSHLAMLKLGIDAEKQFSLSYINNWIKAEEKYPPVFDAAGRELSKGEVLQLNLATVLPAVDALLKTVGEKEASLNKEALNDLKGYKATPKTQPEQQKPVQKEEKVEIEPLRILKETDKAVMVKVPGANPEDPKKGVWLPRSRISTNKDGFVYEATPSLIKEKGLTPKASLAAMKGAKAQRSLKI